MAKRLLIAASFTLAVHGVAAQAATAKGVGTDAAPQGVTVSGSDHRFTALSPGTPGRLTVIARSDRQGGRVSRWWYLRGSYFVPAVAYDGSAGGLSADGTTLVLSRFSRTYPPRTTRLAILETGRTLTGPIGERRPSRFVNFVDLRGSFSFDAISPDGSTIYLIHYLSGNPTDYEVRALDVDARRLLPKPIVDPEEPDEQMAGLPVTRASSPDGRWAYTLYDGNGKEPFIHALDTVGRRAVCIDLPQLEKRRNLFLLRFEADRRGHELALRSLSTRDGGPKSGPLLAVDTRSFEVHDPATAVARSGNGGPPWLLIGAVGGTFAFALTLLVRGARGTGTAPNGPIHERDAVPGERLAETNPQSAEQAPLERT